jgi:hypothetical protein
MGANQLIVEGHGRLMACKKLDIKTVAGDPFGSPDR